MSYDEEKTTAFPDTRGEIKDTVNRFAKRLESERSDLNRLMEQVRSVESSIEFLSTTVSALEKSLSTGEAMPAENGRMASYR